MKRVLIVDDEVDHRLIIRAILEHCGYACDEAEDGTIALERLTHAPVDLVLADVNMPRTNGLQLVDHMTRQQILKDIPIILMSSQIYGELPLSGAKGKALTILLKPFNRQKLCAAVSSAIEVHH